jgi:predicted O-methyltransferase YrrM
MVDDGHGRVALTALPPAPAAALTALYAREPQRGDDGLLHPVDATTRIKPEEGFELIALLEHAGADAVLEICLAYGFSSQFLLAGLQQRGGGRLAAIDPFQSAGWQGIGRRLAQATVAATGADFLSFRCIEERSDWALPQLERQGERFGLIFVDGNHRFDDVLLDVTAAARLCLPGGVIVLHDLWLPSVRAVVAFLTVNRADLVRLPCRCPNLAAFACTGPDQRNWDHFVPFTTEGEAWRELA